MWQGCAIWPMIIAMQYDTAVAMGRVRTLSYGRLAFA
jgi:hypothetical protein